MLPPSRLKNTSSPSFRAVGVAHLCYSRVLTMFEHTCAESMTRQKLIARLTSPGTTTLVKQKGGGIGGRPYRSDYAFAFVGAVTY